MNTLWKVNNLLYSAGPELVNTIRIGIILTEQADEQSLRLALETASANDVCAFGGCYAD